MRRFIVAVAVPKALASATAQANRSNQYAACPVTQFRAFSAKVWRLDRWRREKPHQKALSAKAVWLECAGAGARRLMLAQWTEDQRAFYAHRRRELWRIRVTPFYGCTSLGGCGWWALPVGIVECESGGSYFFPYGAYSILDTAWQAWGGQTARAGEAPKREQDRVAHVGWRLYGESPWECKSDGSTSWP
jgi:hypothetical protein